MIEYIKYNRDNKWVDFEDRDITRPHALNLFANGVEVIIKEDGTFICNRNERRKTYRKAGHRAVMLTDMVPVERLILDVGFQGGA